MRKGERGGGEGEGRGGGGEGGKVIKRIEADVFPSITVKRAFASDERLSKNACCKH